MNIKSIPLAALAATIVATVPSPSSAAVPDVTDVTMTQAANRLVTITYTLTDAPAVVTLDIETNATGDVWASIGGENIQNVDGDVWKRVETGSHTIQWRPDLSWPDHKIADGGARAVLTAWALDNTPDYMVVDISAAAQPNTQKYYPSAESIPGGLLDNDVYRKTTIVMRKIMAKGVTWTMGSTAFETERNASREATQQVTLTNNYYIGVFPITQEQWGLIQTSRVAPSYFANLADRSMRPVEQVSYNEIRNAANSTTANTTYNWPAAPNSGSFLGLLRTKTGIDFDLPCEAQWEFAARAGNGSTKWGDGSGIQNQHPDANLNLLGRYRANGGGTNPAASSDATTGTAIVGTYKPNDWGIYDMYGNVWEWCLDWYQDNISTLGGKVNINPANSAQTVSGSAGSNRTVRGGGCTNIASECRPAFRTGRDPSSREKDRGFRVICYAGLQ